MIDLVELIRFLDCRCDSAVYRSQDDMNSNDAPPPCDSQSNSVKERQRANRRWAIAPVAVFLTLTLGGPFVLSSAFGSFPAALRYLRGERLIVAPADIRIERPEIAASVTVASEVRNFSDRPVNLLGANASCSCVVMQKLPATIPPSGVFELPITVHVAPDKIVDETVVLFTDHPNHARLSVRVRALSPLSP